MIRLRFSRGTGPAAALVRGFTWSWCAHVGIMHEPNTVLDACPGVGVSVRQIDPNDDATYFNVALEEPKRERVFRAALSQLGKPYDWVGALGVGLHRDWGNTEAWFCSELVAWAFKEAGFDLLRTNHLDRITPRDLLLSPYLIALR